MTKTTSTAPARKKVSVRRKTTVAPSNKFRYYEVTRTFVVRALNASEATAIANGRRGVSGEVLGSATTASRVPADQARSSASSLV